MDMPPTRFRIVERDRRLIVIDTHADPGSERLRGMVPADRRRKRGGSVARGIALVLASGATTADGDPILETRPSYDDKAPRLIAIGPEAQRRVAIAAALQLVAIILFGVIAVESPAAILLPLAFLNEQVRGWARRRVTAWLDRVQAEADSSSG